MLGQLEKLPNVVRVITDVRSHSPHLGKHFWNAIGEPIHLVVQAHVGMNMVVSDFEPDWRVKHCQPARRLRASFIDWARFPMPLHGSPFMWRYSSTLRMVNVRGPMTPRSRSSQASGIATGAPAKARTEYGATAV